MNRKKGVDENEKKNAYFSKEEGFLSVNKKFFL